jgi:hypothetical protein
MVLLKCNVCVYVYNFKTKFWEELIAYFLLIQHGLYREQCIQHFFVAMGSLLCCYLAMMGDIQTHKSTQSQMRQ